MHEIQLRSDAGDICLESGFPSFYHNTVCAARENADSGRPERVGRRYPGFSASMASYESKNRILPVSAVIFP